MVQAGSDGRHAACGRGRDGALAGIADPATPGNDAAVLLQGETVIVAGRDCRHAACHRGRDRALPPVDKAAAAPGDDAPVRFQSEAVVAAGCYRCDAACHRRGAVHWPASRSLPHPQATTLPSVVRARLWKAPAAIAATPLPAVGGTVHWPSSPRK